VERISADPEAVDEIEDHYQTSGELSVPLVTLHTTGDAVVPYWHATRYRDKTIASHSFALHRPMTIDRHGHCNFYALEIIAAFNQLVDMVEHPPELQHVFLPVVARGP
jgi:hypothetical protein